MSREQSLNSRNICLSMLIETLENKRLSHYVVADTLDDKKWSGNTPALKRDKDFIMALFMGTLEKLIYIDFAINSFSSVNIQKMKPVIRNILRLSIYQLYFMDSVPERAALSEALKLCEIRKLSGLKGFVNGVLHTAVRKKDELEVPEHIKSFVPKWFYTLVNNQYGKEAAFSFFEAVNLKNTYTAAKLNTVYKGADDIIKSLEADGCEVEKIADVSDGVYLRKINSVTELEAYKKGWIYIQDVNSMKIAEAADDYAAGSSHETSDGMKTYKKNPMLIVDVCAAPGGKTVDLAIKYPDATIVSRDINENKINLVKENIKRLGLVNVQTQVVDAMKETPELKGRADIVVADLPCSGLGVISKKPDIKLRVKEKDLESLEKLQREILSVVQAYVKPEGMLIYSTCTVNKGENEENAKWFAENFDFSLEYMKQFLPGTDSGDGFFIAEFIKNGH